ncbi:TPA: hypothetical protein DIS55_01120 [Candidatus Kaiserbacteria bacterium]|uniref:Uncharacterized protein n=1 Tax=Candidatus Kaiserbacteria bacterium RIFCSPLOWO2_12_FULL_50_28 TaxID=1798527 RepID=A0A1F6FPV8_9BACT|nr:MAG: hypothetical protein A3H15_00035 [Candidatus Kaiserbacteria bacterium RIFCSPLOWO2_12_FULL_50_28]HCM43537.1 hypothetical protein [Candidatus Kaiserbacteria bacterium]
MAQSSRKSHRISESPSHNPRVDDSEKDTQLRIAENDKVNEAKFVEKLERDFGKGKPLEVHMKDIKALRTFRNAFPSVKHANPENLNFYVINPELDVAITRAFGLKDSKNIKFLTETRGEAKLLKDRGYDAEKGIAEKHRISEQADVVIVMNEKVRPSSRLLKNVAPGGWILLPLVQANVLRGTGKYTCMGILDSEGMSPSVKDVGEDFWENTEIETDEELKNVSEESKDEGVVTYEEAAHAVKEVFGTEQNVVQNYKKLIEMAKKQNSSAANGATKLMCNIERVGGTAIEISIKTILPLREKELRGENYAIFKKNEFV